MTTTDLRAQLQAALGGAYALDRELGGGGMPRYSPAAVSRMSFRACTTCSRSVARWPITRRMT